MLGGVFGLVTAAIDVVFEEATGKSVLSNIASAVSGESKPSAGTSETEYVSRRYRSVADAHKRHLHTWSA